MIIFSYIKLFFLSLFQDHLIFKPKTPDIEKAMHPSDYGLRDMVEISLKSGNKQERISLWIKQPDKKKPMIIFFHGNTGHFGDVGKPKKGEVYDRHYRLKLLREIISRGYGIIAPSLRGYGDSQGKPSEANFIEDLEIISDFLRKEDHQDIILLGESLGAFKALYLAKLLNEANQPISLITLIAPFANLEEKVFELHPDLKKLNVRKYLKHNFNNKKLLEENNFNSRILLLHPEDDETTKPYHSEILEKTAKEHNLDVKLNFLEGSGHITWQSNKVFELIEENLGKKDVS